jgi:hypothetical protein
MKKSSTIGPNLGTLVDNLFDLRAKKGAIQAQIKVLEEDETRLEQQVIDALNAQGLDQARGKKATVSISETDVPQVVDWDEFHAFLIRRKVPHLLQRRVAPNAYREMQAIMKTSQPLPGCTDFAKISLNVRKV